MPRLAWIAAWIALLVVVPPAFAVPAWLFGWGTGGTLPGQFQSPHGLAVAPNGWVYVADTFNNRVQRFSATGTWLSQWSVTDPGAVEVDGSGNVYVLAGNRVIRYTATGGFVTQWGTAGSGPGQFQFPLDLAVDAAGFVYVADWMNHRIQKFTGVGSFVTMWGTPGTGDGQFDQPASVCAADGFVYVTEIGNQRVQKFTSSGSFVARWGDPGTGPGPLFPTGIAVDANGFILVADSGSHRVLGFRSDGSYVWAFGSFGTANGQFNHPTALDTSADRIYVLDKDNARVQVFAALATPALTTSWGRVKRLWR